MVIEPEPWFCYMLRCSDDSLYVGMTNDVAVRVEKHNRGLGPEYTRKRRPVQLIWSQQLADRNAARKREVELKSWSRTKKLGLVGGLEKSEGQTQETMVSGVSGEPFAGADRSRSG